VSRLEEMVTGLEKKLGCVQTEDTFNIVFEGCNVHIRNGMDRTEPARALACSAAGRL
jgi:hypothetical protein